MKLLLIRHGLTDANATHVIQGHQPTPLNATGLRQAELLAQRLASRGPALDALVSSDLLRAQQTAAAIATACGRPIILDAAWRERSFGPWEGRTLTEQQIWTLASGEFTPPGAEEPQAFRERVHMALLSVVEHHTPNQTVAIVTHGGPCRVILRLIHDGILPTSGPKPEMAMIANCSVMHLECKRTQTGHHWRLTCLNDVEHLAEDTQISADAG